MDRLIEIPREKGILDKFLDATGRDFSIKWVFDYFKGYGICALLGWAGWTGYSTHTVSWAHPGSIIFLLGSMTLMAIASSLAFLNLLHGILWCAKSPLKISRITFTIFYSLLTYAVLVLLSTKH